jgi:hypothetical protein
VPGTKQTGGGAAVESSAVARVPGDNATERNRTGRIAHLHVHSSCLSGHLRYQRSCHKLWRGQFKDRDRGLNIVPSRMRPTQSGKRMSQRMDGVRQAARTRKQKKSLLRDVCLITGDCPPLIRSTLVGTGSAPTTSCPSSARARRRSRSDVTQSKNADSQDAYPSLCCQAKKL